MISWQTIRDRLSGWTRKIFSHTPRLVDTRDDFLLMQRALGRRAPNFRQFRYMARVLPRSEKIAFLIARTIFIFSLVALAGGYLFTFRHIEPAIGGEYVEGVVGSPRLINPIFASQNEVDMGLVRLTYSGLMRFDTNGQAVSDLAESSTVSQDQKVYTFKLKSATWHDGESVTASDVAFTFELLKDKTVASPLAPSFAGVQQVKALDEKTVEFTLSEPYPAFLTALTLGILPEHVWGSVPRDQIRLAETNVKPVGSGPYEFKRIIKESNGFISRYELERYPGYYGNTTYIKEIAFQFYSDYEGAGGALEALRTKKILGLSFVPALYRDKIPTQHVDLHTLQVPQYTALFFNLEGESPVTDKNVRKGLELAINKFKILQDTLADEGTVLEGPVLPGFPGYTEAKVTGANPEEANTVLDKAWPRVNVDDYKKVLIADYIREHLTQAATSTSSTPALVTNDAATEAAAKAAVDEILPPAQLFYRKNSAQKYLTVRLITADTAEYRQAAALLAGYWQDIGVRTDITYVSARDIGRIALKNRDYDVLLYGVIVGSDPDQFPFWHSSQVSYPGLNLSGYTNTKVDELLSKIRQTTDFAALNTLYIDFQKLLRDDVPAIFLYSPHYTYALDNSVKGFAVERITQPADRFANITEWYVKNKSTFKFD